MTKHSENTKPSNSTKPVLANRLLIFRAWVKKQNRMIEVYGFNEHLVFEQTLDSPSIKENIFEIADCHIIQFTGLKDIEGKKIYEGDIILGYNNPHVVTFADGAFYLTYKNSSVRLSRTCGALKIIGNIFENIELTQTTSYAVC